MNTQIAADYHCSITARISATEAMEKISNVSAWWANNFEGNAKRAGDVFTVRFGETWVTFILSEFVPGQKTVWHVEDCQLPFLKDKKEWRGTDIVWEVSSQNGVTRLDMTHIGLVPEVECFENCQSGWNHFIKDSLFKLFTENKGLPEGK